MLTVCVKIQIVGILERFMETNLDLQMNTIIETNNINNIAGLPIGFMDSGLGGISVLKEAVKLMPNENFLYYGDSANAPYGTKSTDEICRLTFAVVEKLLRQGIKGLAVACNTATGAAVRKLRAAYPKLPIVGIEPAIKPAVEKFPGERVLVLATPMAIKQEKFHKLLEKYADMAEVVPVPCAGLMEFVEKGILNGPVLDEYFKEHLSPYVTKETKAIVLGCTHYPFLRPHIREYFGEELMIVDGSYGTAKELKNRLAQKNLLRTDDNKQIITIENSSTDAGMIELSNRLLKLDIN